MTVTQDLAAYIVNTNFEDLPKPVVEKAKIAIIDSIGCAFAGSQSAIGRPIVDMAIELGGTFESTILGTQSKSTSQNAAWANAESANALDYDDAFPYSGHPGSPIIQTALAFGESLGSSGQKVLTAIILGYEITTRIAIAILPSTDYYGKTSGHSFMTFGTAAVASKLLGLDHTQTTWALGSTAAAAPIPSDKKCTINPYNVQVGAPHVKNNSGHSAMLGIRYSLLAQRGYTGPIDILEGDTGFFRMYGSDNNDPTLMTKGLGEDYNILKLGFKPWSCCRLYHSILDAAMFIQNEHNVTSDEIEEVLVHTFTVKTKPPADDIAPKTLQSAADSIPYSLAVALAGIPPGLQWFEEKTLNNPQILDLSKRVKLIPDPSADALRGQDHYSVATVELHTKSQHYSHRVECPKGDVKNPMTQTELEQKFSRLAGSVIPVDPIQQIIRVIKNFDQLQNLQHLTENFCITE